MPKAVWRIAVVFAKNTELSAAWVWSGNLSQLGSATIPT